MDQEIAFEQVQMGMHCRCTDDVAHIYNRYEENLTADVLGHTFYMIGKFSVFYAEFRRQ